MPLKLLSKRKTHKDLPLFLRKALTKKPTPKQLLGVPVVRHDRAKRLSLRLDTRLGDIVLVWPKRVSLKMARAFVLENKEWIKDQRMKITPKKKFRNGMKLKICGTTYTIEHRKGRGVTEFKGNKILVYGAQAHLPRRVRDFLKDYALQRLTTASNRKARRLNLEPSPIRVMDPQARWGSCDPKGRIMYSWRLIFAPVDVMDYLVAHEVSHRVHLDHSRRFWNLCGSLCKNAEKSRQWLHDNGQELMVYDI